MARTVVKAVLTALTHAEGSTMLLAFGRSHIDMHIVDGDSACQQRHVGAAWKRASLGALVRVLPKQPVLINLAKFAPRSIPLLLLVCKLQPGAKRAGDSLAAARSSREYLGSTRVVYTQVRDRPSCHGGHVGL